MGQPLPSLVSRRDLLAAGAAGLMATLAAPRSLLAAGAVTAGPRKKIALLGTVIFEHSHTQHILDRLASGYSWQGFTSRSFRRGMEKKKSPISAGSGSSATA